jgi:hypothetical protein
LQWWAAWDEGSAQQHWITQRAQFLRGLLHEPEEHFHTVWLLIEELDEISCFVHDEEMSMNFH